MNDACTTEPTFNVKGVKQTVYCKQHAEGGMVDVCNKHCFHDSCTRKPSFIVKGIKQTVYRKQHAEEGMVDVCKKHYCTDSWLSLIHI